MLTLKCHEVDQSRVEVKNRVEHCLARHLLDLPLLSRFSTDLAAKSLIMLIV